ncbi:MAG TPA: histidine triad nucleotide-binding protein [Terriglobia bacterium]|nr:histidine triad nucleotide-binding protein [Terriglobia bacterium]
MTDCIFCRIVQREIPAKIVFEDEAALAFEDIRPEAPVHLLVIPKQHIASLSEVTGADQDLIGHLFAVAGNLARERNLEGGYRTVMNNGAGAGQTVFHLHVHLLGGRAFHWPPG